MTASSTGDKTEGIAYATIGGGNISVGSGRNLNDLNRDIDKVDEITKELITGALDGSMTIDHRMFSREGADSALEDLRKYEEYEEKYGFVPNPFPGLGINGSIMGEEYWETGLDLEYVPGNNDGRNIIGEDNLTSDQNPLLKAGYHFLPWGKSGSEGHDVQMKLLEIEKIDNYLATQGITPNDPTYKSSFENAKREGHGKIGKWELISSIPGSFTGTMARSIGVMLDVPNWKKNMDKIKKSYELRRD